jgi:hypothetical protein
MILLAHKAGAQPLQLTIAGTCLGKNGSNHEAECTLAELKLK